MPPANRHPIPEPPRLRPGRRLLGGWLDSLGEGYRKQRYREQLRRVPIDETGHSLLATVFCPPGRGPFPLVVLNHGSPRNPARRRAAGRWRLPLLSRHFCSLGAVVIIPMRRGFASSDGDFAEDYGSCDDPDYTAAGLAAARDVDAAIRYLAEDPLIDPHRVLVGGVSAGGWAALAYASLPDEERSVAPRLILNLSGGRGSQRPHQVCHPGRLIAAAGHYARTGSTPALWLYAEDDDYFSPEIVNGLAAAYERAGRPPGLHWVPVGHGGHRFHASPSGFEAIGGPLRQAWSLLSAPSEQA